MCRIILLLLTSICLISQSYSSNKSFAKIEQHVFDKQLDSAILLLQKDSFNLIKQDSSYFSFLSKELKDFENWDYNSHGRLINSAYYRIEPEIIGNYYTENLPLDIAATDFDERLFYIYYVLLGMFRESGDINRANEYYEMLSLYSKNTKASASEKSYTRQRIRLLSHEAVLAGIARNVPEGMETTKRMLEMAYEIKDTSLIVLSNYFRMEFLIPQGKINEYIALAEQSLELEKNSASESELTYSISSNLIDAYIYKGVEKEKTWSLLTSLNQAEGVYQSLAYPFYLKALLVYDESSIYRKKIYQIWDANNIPELADTIWQKSKLELLKPEQKQILSSMTGSLASLGEYKSAYEYSTLLSALNKELYSDELKSSISSLNSTVEIQKKELKINELEKEKQAGDFWFLFALLLAVVAGAVVILVLLNNRKNKKLAQVAQDKFKELTQYKEAFYRYMANELKESITGIESGLNEFVLQEKDIKPSSKGAINFALHNVDKVKDRINEILVISKVEENTIKPKVKDFYPKPLFEGLLKQYDQEVEIKGLNLKLNIDIEPNERFSGDRTLVKILVQNVVYAAIKNSPENKEIVVRASLNADMLEVDVNEQSRFPSIQQQQVLFGRDVQLEKTNKLERFGLGLSVAKKLANILKGNIGIYPGANESTTYTLQLPRL